MNSFRFCLILNVYAMKKCLIVINRMSGKAAKIDKEKLLAGFCAEYEVTVKELTKSSDEWSATGYSLVVACGGDGTFNRALNLCAEEGADLVYYGFGTFNECAKAKGACRHQNGFIRLYEYAAANGRYFGYVAATGSFTPLGYVVDPSVKQKMGVLAYLLRVVREYKVWNVKARVTADGDVYDGVYTLIMAIDSPRCFGFRFNRLYSPDDGKVHLLLVKSPGKDNLVNRAKIFFPLFRAFFIGLRKELTCKNLIFRAVKELDISLPESAVFDVDGDAAEFKGDLLIRVTKPKNKVYIGDFDSLTPHSDNKHPK